MADGHQTPRVQQRLVPPPTRDPGEPPGGEHRRLRDHVHAVLVASDVDRRYIARYGPILASTFIAGYAESAAQTGVSILGSESDSLVVEDTPSVENNLFAGLSAASQAIAENIARNAPAGPEIVLEDGYGIGILFVDPVEDPGSDR